MDRDAEGYEAVRRTPIRVQPPMPLAVQVESEQERFLADLYREAFGDVERDSGTIAAREKRRRYYAAAAARLRAVHNARMAARRFGGAS